MLSSIFGPTADGLSGSAGRRKRALSLWQDHPVAQRQPRNASAETSARAFSMSSISPDTPYHEAAYAPGVPFCNSSLYCVALLRNLLGTSMR